MRKLPMLPDQTALKHTQGFAYEMLAFLVCAVLRGCSKIGVRRESYRAG